MHQVVRAKNKANGVTSQHQFEIHDFRTSKKVKGVTLKTVNLYIHVDITTKET